MAAAASVPDHQKQPTDQDRAREAVRHGSLVGGGTTVPAADLAEHAVAQNSDLAYNYDHEDDELGGRQARRGTYRIRYRFDDKTVTILHIRPRSTPATTTAYHV